MHITSREREIIGRLLSHQSGVTVSELSEQLNVSQRTIHRELKGVERILNAYDLTLKKKSGVGLLLLGEENKQTELKVHLLKQISDFTRSEREELILLALLKRADTTKLIVLANDFKVTVKTISEDLKNIEKQLAPFNIELIRKKGHGISLSATEEQKRNALGYFLSKQFNEYEFLELLKNPSNGQSHFLEIIKIEQLTLASGLITEMIEKHQIKLTDHGYMTLTIHLSLATCRIIQQELITMDDDLLKALKDDPKFEIAIEIASTIEDVFNVIFPEAELGYITMHLKGARLTTKTMFQPIYRSSCKQLIKEVSDYLRLPFDQDPTLLTGLLKHIEPAIYRIQRGLDLYNPLTTKVMTEYPQLFEATKQGLKKTFTNLNFTESEIAYVVLYFGASQVLYDIKQDLYVVVICPSGLGSSKMLRTRIEKEFKGIQVTTLSLSELKVSDLSTFDLVLSTVEIPEKFGKYTLISPILNEDEITLMGQKIKQISRPAEQILLSRIHDKRKNDRTGVELEGEFQRIKNYSTLILTLLDHFELHNFSTPLSLDDLTNEMLRVLKEEKGLITNLEKVKDDLTARAKQGGFAIPNTAIALYHCQTSDVITPVFNMFHLRQPLTMNTMNHRSTDVTRILLLLAPTNVSELGLEILSSISAALVEDDTAVDCFTTSNQADIKTYLNQLFYNKLKRSLK